MPLIVPPGFAQAVYSHTWTGDSEPMVITLGHDVSLWGGSFQDAADFLHRMYGDWMVANLADVITFTHVSLYVGQDGGGSLPYDSTGDPVVGTADGTALPSNCAYLVRKRTDAAGRRGRGRMYIPGCGEGQVDNLGNVDAAHRLVIQADLDGWMTGLTGGGVDGEPTPPYLFHRSEGAGVEPPPTPITLFQIEEKIATQRQRLRP